MSAQVIEVMDDVVCVRRPSYLTCSYLWRRGAEVVLIDAGMKTDASDVLAGLAHWNLPVDAVRACFVSHWHNDHSAGAARIKERSGCAVYYAEAESPQLLRQTATGGALGWLSDAIPEAGPLVLAKGLLGEAPMAAVEADRYVQDGERVEGLDVLFTPGHTSGHLSFFEPERGLLFAGDALAVVDGELRFMSRPVTEDLDAARASMERCHALSPSWVLAGHREPLQVTQAHLDRFRARLDAAAPPAGDWPLLG